MTTYATRRKEDSGTRSARTTPSLDEETNPRVIPTTWLADAHDEPVQSGETRYYATLYTVERQLASDPDVLAGHKQGRAEEWTVHILYVRADGQRRVERNYDAHVADIGGSIQVTPRRFTATIAVDGRRDTPHSAPRSEEIVAALADLHDIDATEEEA